MLSSIVVAVDGSDHGTKALEFAIAQAKVTEAKLIIVHILLHGRANREIERMAEAEHLAKTANLADADIMKHPFTMKAWLDRMEDERRAEAFVAVGERLALESKIQAQEAGIAKVETVVENGDVAATIVSVAKRYSADLVVVGSRGLGTISEILLGSVSHKICQTAPCSVTVVK